MQNAIYLMDSFHYAFIASLDSVLFNIKLEKKLGLGFLMLLIMRFDLYTTKLSADLEWVRARNERRQEEMDDQRQSSGKFNS